MASLFVVTQIITNAEYVFCEDLVEPFSNLARGQVLSFKYPYAITRDVRFDNVILLIRPEKQHELLERNMGVHR